MSLLFLETGPRARIFLNRREVSGSGFLKGQARISVNLGFYLATLIRSSGLLFLVVLLFIFAVSMSVLIDCNYINNSDNYCWHWTHCVPLSQRANMFVVVFKTKKRCLSDHRRGIKWYLEILTLTQNLSFAARLSSIDGFVIREFTIFIICQNS